MAGLLVISLSTIPARFAYIEATLASLLKQSTPADRIILYIPHKYRRFPNWDGVLPTVPSGVEIRRVAEDLGPATKVLIAAREFRGQNCDILFCDDDRDYPPDMTTRFMQARDRYPGCAIAGFGRQADTMAASSNQRDHQPRAIRRWRITDVDFQLRYLWRQIRAGRNWARVAEPRRKIFKRSGYIDIFEGFGGVLVRPEYFDDVAYDIPPVLWSVDDVWLSGMIARSKVPIWLLANQPEPTETAADAYAPLALSVNDGADRQTANAMAVRYMQQHFGIWQ